MSEGKRSGLGGAELAEKRRGAIEVLGGKDENLDA
jgi:hypothetical protein